MGSYYEAAWIGEGTVWVVWNDQGVEKKVEASDAQREWLTGVMERLDAEMQSCLRDISNGICAGGA